MIDDPPPTIGQRVFNFVDGCFELLDVLAGGCFALLVFVGLPLAILAALVKYISE